MSIDFSMVKTSAQIEMDKHNEAVNSVKSERKNAYRQEADGLKFQAEYEALLEGVDVDYSEWMAKVAEIKLRLPFPVSPEM